MESWKIDVSVLLIFFNRPILLKQVFEQVQIARPSKLFLYQDGPREGNTKDIIGIDECRKVVAEVDWDCEVHYYYQDKNIGCDPSEYIAQKWAFGIVDQCIVLEDDDVPSQSFFTFCKEMLEKYQYDERINIISGMNHLGKTYGKSSYFFVTNCSISGWASWKRVVDEWEPNYLFLQDKETVQKLKDNNRKSNYIDMILKNCKEHKLSGKAHYESILASAMFLNHRLNIVPKFNLISNIGIASESTHSVDTIDKLPKGIRRVFYMKTYELKFPLKHPRYMIENIDYQKKLFKIMGWKHPEIKFYRVMELFIMKLKKNGLKSAIQYLSQMIQRKVKIHDYIKSKSHKQ